MKAPLILRAELAWALLTGKFVSISHGPSTITNEHCWHFEVAQKPRGWERRRQRRAQRAARTR
jgi:hypothetical protein